MKEICTKIYNKYIEDDLSSTDTCIYWQFQYILYLYILTVSIHSSLWVNENPTTHSIGVALGAKWWCQNQRHWIWIVHTLFVCESVRFLRSRLSWTRTDFSTFGCTNLFLHLLCIHPFDDPKTEWTTLNRKKAKLIRFLGNSPVKILASRYAYKKSRRTKSS